MTHLHILIRRCWVLLLALVVCGCVSTQQPSKYQVDEEKALESHVSLALKYIETQNRESARHHLRKAFEIDQRSVKANFAMAMLYQLEGELELAGKQFRKTLRLERDYTRARNNYAAFLYSQGDYQQAYEQFNIAVDDLDYDNRSQALVNLGRTAKKLGKLDKALSAFEQADRLNPSMPVVKYELASLSFEQNDYKTAKKYLKDYERIARPVPQTLLLGIKIERMFGNKDKAASYALLLNNKYPYSQENLEYKKMLEQGEKDD